MTPESVRRATARDVAALARVSVATVSLVANGKADGRVTPATQERVRVAIAALDYRVNSTASALARGRPETVAFVSPDSANPFFALVLEGLLEQLDSSLSLTVLLPRGGGDYDPATVQKALAADLAGLVLVSPDPSLLEAVAVTCPTVLLDSGQTRAGMVSIDLDMVSAGRELADHLVDLGHRRVAYVDASRDKVTFHRRRDGLQARLVERGADLAVSDILIEGMSSATARDTVSTVMRSWVAAGVTAVVCADDLLAYGVLEAARSLGVAVPTDLSIAGFNDLPYSAMMTPALTSVDLSARDLGAAAGRAITGMLLRSTTEPNAVLGARVVARASTAVAP